MNQFIVKKNTENYGNSFLCIMLDNAIVTNIQVIYTIALSLSFVKNFISKMKGNAHEK
jgi:hypothetical protein